jgi:hypothetical protein
MDVDTKTPPPASRFWRGSQVLPRARLIRDHFVIPTPGAVQVIPAVTRLASQAEHSRRRGTRASSPSRGVDPPQPASDDALQ